MSKKRAQVSIEALLLAGIIIMISVSVFAYYLQTRDSTVGMTVIKLNALKKIEESKDLTVIEKIAYRIDPGGEPDGYFCIYTKSKKDIWDPTEPADLLALASLEDDIEAMTDFDNVSIKQNPEEPGTCE